MKFFQINFMFFLLLLSFPLEFQFNIRVMSEKAYNYLQIIPPKPKIDARKIIKSPMPGVVKSIAVNVGDEVCIRLETFIHFHFHIFSF